tara:strand:- start:3520 stop:4137 length:618 start_codon:yes stop_codon:yes gene_type:complete
MAKRSYNRRRGTGKTPIRNDGPGRKQRLKAAQVARKTGSKDRMTRGRGVSRTATGAPRGASGPATPPQQGPRRALPKNITMGGPSGPKTKSNLPPKRTPSITKVGKQLAAAGTIVNPRSDVPAKVAAAASLVASYMSSRKPKTATKKPAKKPMANMGKNYKQKEKELSRKANADNFDRAFAAARKAGKKTFTWRGKSYHTRMKGE